MIPYLPSVDATLNAASAVFLTLGFFFIRQRNIRAHKTCMLSAFATSTIFLVCYLTYHYFHGTTHFLGQGAVRSFYFVLLGSHTVLAARDRAAGTHHALPRLAGALPAAQTNRPLDPAPLALRLGDGRARLLDALSPLSGDRDSMYGALPRSACRPFAPLRAGSKVGSTSCRRDSFDSCRERVIMGARNLSFLTTRIRRGIFHD